MIKKFLFLLLSLYTLTNFSQTIVPFEIRYTTSTKGSIDFVSNASVKCDGSGAGGANCSDLDIELPPFFDSWSQNNDHNAEYIDIDADPTTFSSSSDSLDLPPCSRIAYAAIYWGGRADDDDPGFSARGNIKIGVNGLGYTDISADTIIDAGAVEGLGNRVYYGFAEITDLVNANPIQSMYTVANIYSRLGGNNRWGGWNIVVVYENDLLPMRNLNVFDGLVNVNNLGTDVEVGISGFLTPPSGSVTFDVGVFAYDGDRGFNGDSLLFDGGAGYVPISNTLNPADDIFNFSQSKSGVVSTSQVPLIHNNISIDADIFSPDNSGFAYIGNSQTSANIKVTTNNETVQVQVLTIAIDVSETDIRAGVRVEDINGGLLESGDTLEYTVMGTNIGSDTAVNSFILDTLADNIEYVPESIEIIYGPNLGAKTDADGDDQAQYISTDKVIRVNIGIGADAFSGGVVPNSPAGIDSTVFKFRAVVIDDCVLLACQNIVENQAYIFGTGAVSGNQLSNQSNPGIFDENGCAVNATTSIVIDISDCPLPADTSVSDYCDGVLFEEFPFDEIGYEYYDHLFSPVTEASGPGIYYAISQTYAGCADTVVITISAFYDAPTISNAGPDQTVCIDPGTATLAGNNPLVGIGLWTVIAGGGTVTTPTAFNSGVTGLTLGVNTFRWTITSEACSTSFDEVNIILDPDSDGDGICDQIDLDDDNDGIPDLVEDLDEDGDGDPTTNPKDTDGDGIPDMFDLDSDNDGIPDIVEAGGTDDNEDGRVDDLNPDGTLVNDTDNDGLDDLYDADNGGADIPNPDTDDDGHSDFQDVDSDNDGIYDIVEDGGVDNDNDGRVDDWFDSDGDGISDYADVDATGGIDIDGDGIDDAVQVGDDEDGDGIADDFDEDANGDGWDDDDATNGLEDTDGDGVFDRLDLDSDNDGTPDILEDGGVDENGDGKIDDFTDLDGDGADDDSMTDGLDDFDGDGVPDHEDLDSDNDGITDAEENGKPDEDGDGIIDDFTDLDGDGWDDDNQTTEQTDTDGDGIPDDTDLDSDNDGILDIIESGGTDINDDGVVDDFQDENGDGLDDTDGGVSPPDTDGDGIDDYQDTDSDNDGVPDVEENDPDGDGSGPDDTDGDGIPDYQDTDDDNDGILTEDESDKDENGVYTDCDLDGIPDYLDPDPCGLTIPTGFSPDGDGINDYFVIEGIAAYPNTSITILNRWGNKVFESMNGYNNDWDGTNQFGMIVGDRNLPVGTYFYILDLGDGSEVIKGYIFINR